MKPETKTLICALRAIGERVTKGDAAWNRKRTAEAHRLSRKHYGRGWADQVRRFFVIDAVVDAKGGVR